jgi:hypothetical protein
MSNFSEKPTLESINAAKAYIKKWEKILFSTKPINSMKAMLAIENACLLLDLPIANILFLSSPFADLEFLKNLPYIGYSTIKSDLKYLLLNSVNDSQVMAPFKWNYSSLTRLDDRFQNLCQKIYAPVAKHLDEWTFFKIINSDCLNSNPWQYDFYINHICREYDPLVLNVWDTWQNLCEECPYLVVINNIFLVIDRPTELFLDNELFPHADGKAAIKFADGNEFHCIHNADIPLEYGQMPAAEWPFEEMLSRFDLCDANEIEKYEELIGVFLRVIGYKEFCHKFPTKKNIYWSIDKVFDYVTLIDTALDEIAVWHHDRNYDLNEYNIAYQSIVGNIDDYRYATMQDFPFDIPSDLSMFYLVYTGKFQMIPNLYSYSLKEAIANAINDLGILLLPVFHGKSGATYYVLCGENHLSRVYYSLPGEELRVYAECFTSWIVSVAQCYQDGAYYTETDLDSGEMTIKQDLVRVEKIFEKYNPNQIETWQNAWEI